MNTFFKTLFLIFPVLISAQQTSETYEVIYNLYENGEKTNNQYSFIYQNGVAYLTKPDKEIQQYIDFNKKENSSTLKLNDTTYEKVTKFDDLPEASYNANTQTFLDFTCYYASYNYFSNKIEVWYTQETAAKGSPYSNYLPNEGALVVEISVNGSKKMSLLSIEKLKKKKTPILSEPREETILVNDSEFEEFRIKSRYTKLQVFKNEIINYDPSLKIDTNTNLVTDRVYHFSKGTVIMKKVKIAEELENSGSIYAKLSCKSNGDAYDRTGSVFLIPANKNVSALTAYQYGLDKLPVYIDNDSNSFQGIIQEKGYTPPIEIMRFYTSFGVDYFNEKREINNYDWANNVSYKEEISKLVPTNEREIWVGVFIGNYDKGGHTVSLDLEFYPSENSKDTIHIGNYISPLFSTVNTLEMSGQNYGNLFGNDTLKMSFELPENIENLQLLYTSTGHGGWEGGDEFNPKLNQIFIDGNEMFKIVPWRTDCATYRMSNPASGNFSDGLSSSDLSRSNWCPATLTPPYIIPLSELTPGQHTIEVVIDQGKNEGTNSSHWNVTGILVGKELKSNN